MCDSSTSSLTSSCEPTAGFFSASSSPWAGPVLFVGTSSGSAAAAALLLTALLGGGGGVYTHSHSAWPWNLECRTHALHGRPPSHFTRRVRPGGCVSSAARRTRGGCTLTLKARRSAWQGSRSLQGGRGLLLGSHRTVVDRGRELRSRRGREFGSGDCGILGDPWAWTSCVRGAAGMQTVLVAGGSWWQAESVQQGRRKMSDGGDGTRTRDGSALGGAGPRSASRGRERLCEYRKERALSITRAHRPPDSLHALAKDVPLINCRSLQSDRARPQSMSAPQKRTLRRWASGLVGRRLCSATSLRIPGSRPPQNLAPWVVVSACLTNWRQDALGRDLLHDDGRPPSVHPRFPHYSIQGRIVVHTKLCNPRMSREFQLHATDEGDELRSVRFAARAMLYDSTRRPIAGAE